MDPITRRQDGWEVTVSRYSPPAAVPATEHRAHTGFFTDRSPPEAQHFWRCAHHPSAIDNYFERRTECMWDCDAQRLEWYHSGSHPEPARWYPTRLVDAQI